MLPDGAQGKGAKPLLHPDYLPADFVKPLLEYVLTYLQPEDPNPDPNPNPNPKPNPNPNPNLQPEDALLDGVAHHEAHGADGLVLAEPVSAVDRLG